MFWDQVFLSNFDREKITFSGVIELMPAEEIFTKNTSFKNLSKFFNIEQY